MIRVGVLAAAATLILGCSAIKDRVTRLPSSASEPDFKGYCGHRRQCDDDARVVCGSKGYDITGEGETGRDVWITYTCHGPSWFTNRDD